MDLIQEGREGEREGGVEERRERWEVRGGEWKGAGTYTVLFSVCVALLYICVGPWVKLFFSL